jgi:hypothetical protein
MRVTLRGGLGVVLLGGLAAFAVCLSLWPRPRPAAAVAAERPHRRPDVPTGAMVEMLMVACEQGQFFGGPVEYNGGGWLMTLPNGEEIDRNGLRAVYAAPVIRLGPEAVPFLLRWVMHDNLAVRYVAAYSLEQITGIQAGFGWFAREDPEHRREQAVARWAAWWESGDRDEVH